MDVGIDDMKPKEISAKVILSIFYNKEEHFPLRCAVAVVCPRSG